MVLVGWSCIPDGSSWVFATYILYSLWDLAICALDRGPETWTIALPRVRIVVKPMSRFQPRSQRHGRSHSDRVGGA